MALNTTYLENNRTNILAQLPVTVTVGGDSYSGARTRVNLDKLYSLGGTVDNYEFSVHLTQSDFTTLPAVGSTVTISAVVYRILARETDAAEIGVVLHLGPEHAEL